MYTNHLHLSNNYRILQGQIKTIKSNYANSCSFYQNRISKMQDDMKIILQLKEEEYNSKIKSIENDLLSLVCYNV